MSSLGALAQRADAQNRAGNFAAALRTLSLLRQRLPQDPNPHALAAAIHLDQAQYRQAAECLARAIALAPGEPDFRLRRAGVFFVQGELGAAARELDSALRRAPGNPALLAERLRVRVLSGDHAGARRTLAARPAWLGPGWRDYWLGVLLCREGRFAAAEKRLLKAGAAARTSDLRGRAGFHALVSRVLAEAPPRSAPARPECLMMGLGYRQPYQVTREVVHLLRVCDVIYSNLSDPAVCDFVGLFGVPLRTIVFRRTDRQSVESARAVLAGFSSRVRRVGVVTRANPVFYGRLAHRLARECRRRGILYRVPGSVSIADCAASMAAGDWGPRLGLQIRDAGRLERLDSRLPVFVYGFLGPVQNARARSRLARAYPPGSECFLLAGAGEAEHSPVPATVAALGPLLERIDSTATLLVLPK